MSGEAVGGQPVLSPVRHAARGRERPLLPRLRRGARPRGGGRGAHAGGAAAALRRLRRRRYTWTGRLARLDNLDDPRSFRLLAANAAASAIRSTGPALRLGGQVDGGVPAWRRSRRTAPGSMRGRASGSADEPARTPSIATRAWRRPCSSTAGLSPTRSMPRARAPGRHRATDERPPARESDERLWAALAAAGAGVYRWDFESGEVEADDNLLRLFGCPLAPRVQTAGGFSGDRSIPGPLPRSQRKPERRLAPADFELEYRVALADASVHCFRKGKTFRDDQGHPAYMTGACVDITERKAAQHERDALARTEKLRALGQMASGVAHDINQSLAAHRRLRRLRAGWRSDEPDPVLVEHTRLARYHRAGRHRCRGNCQAPAHVRARATTWPDGGDRDQQPPGPGRPTDGTALARCRSGRGRSITAGYGGRRRRPYPRAGRPVCARPSPT